MKQRWGALCLLLFVACKAQSPSDGLLESGTYTNNYFHYAYTWPKNMKAIDTSTLNIKYRPSLNEFMLFSAKLENQPSGIIMMAERLGPTKEDPVGIRDGNDFLLRVQGSWDGHNKKLSQSQIKGVNGLVFEELDYMYDAEYDSAITTQIGQFLLAFRCNARSSSELLQMNQSILASRIVNSTSAVR